MIRVVTLGESMGLLHTTTPGALEFQHQLNLGFGGAESNVAIALAKFGFDVTWVSRLGKDALGRLIVSGVLGQGVKPHVEWDELYPTGIMLRNVPRKGVTKVLYYRKDSAASAMTPSLAESLDWSGVHLFHTSGISLSLSETASATVKRACELAKAAGARVSVDVNYRSQIIRPDEFRLRLLAVLSDVDILFGSADELSLLSPSANSGEDAARNIGAEFGSEVVIKRGPTGAAAWIDGNLFEHTGTPVDELDPVGAGDAFVGGYLATALQGSDVAKALEVAHRMGALSTLAPGDWEGQPQPHELFSEIRGVER